MTTKHVLIAVLLAGLFAPALAEEARGGPGWMRGIVVTNAPYSALAVTERTQVLADGNQIVDRRTTMTWRDSAGRTRQEFRDAKGELVTVTINDPAAATNLILDPRAHTVVRIDAAAAARAAATRAERMRKEGGADVIVKRVEGDDAERRRIQRDVRIEVSKALAGNGDTARDMRIRMAPLMNGMFADVKWAAKATTKDLGTRDFAGIKAEGKLRSYEIPAGEIGNRNPIIVSDETWTAPDLQVTVYTKHSDPRSGDTVFHLENVRREEPAASLFAAPADYTVRAPGGRWRADK